MSTGKLCKLNTSLRSLHQLRRSISTIRALSKPIPPQSPPLMPHVRRYTGGRRFEYPERYERRTAINWGVRMVPEQEAYVIERFGKFNKVLDAGIHVLMPVIDRIAYIHSLKEQTIPIPNQAAVTTDNVSVHIDGVLYVKIVDPKKASYGVEDPLFAVTQLAQTTMRSAIGKRTLDKTFMERDNLNAEIVESISEAAANWGLVCLRYEIRDIIPPPGVKDSMDMQAEAERRKRAVILEAEGKRQATILASEAERQAIILASEAARTDQVNRAEGEAQAIRARGMATADAINSMSLSLGRHGGQEAASLKIAEQYMQAFSKLAQESTTVLLPSSVSDPASIVTQALTLYKSLATNKPSKDFNENSNTKSSEKFDDEASSREIEDEDPSSGITDATAPERPGFSLQSPKISD